MEIENEIRIGSIRVESAEENQRTGVRASRPVPDPIERAFITNESSTRAELRDIGPADGFASGEREGEQVLAEALTTVVWHSHFRLP